MTAPSETLPSETVLVTGATGFVGSHIAEACARAGFGVRYTARASSRLEWLADLEAVRVTADLLDRSTLPAAVDGVSVVVHAAGITRARDPDRYQIVNARGTEWLARAAGAAGVERFVLISSLAARGPDRQAGTGPGPQEVGSERADAPVSAYGRSKLDAEAHLLRIVQELEGTMEVVILRPSGVYGPRDKDLLPMFRMAARGFLVIPGEGPPLQPLFVGDAARAATIAAAGGMAPGPYELAESRAYAWQEVAGALEAALGRKVRTFRVPATLLEAAGLASELAARLTGGEPAFDRRRATDLVRLRWTCDTRSSERALGWRAEVSLADGMRRTVAWYREAGWIPS